ncbi:MAG: hypothetical protein MI749_14525 [Desulfovibrionales bacterium]|nr:hypothetical protein [Desulfovibrionales bacterium]
MVDAINKNVQAQQTAEITRKELPQEAQPRARGEFNGRAVALAGEAAVDAAGASHVGEAGSAGSGGRGLRAGAAIPFSRRTPHVRLPQPSAPPLSVLERSASVAPHISAPILSTAGARPLTSLEEARDSGRMSPEDFEKAAHFIAQLRAKYGESVAEAVSQQIWTTKKYQKFTHATEKKIEKIARTLAKRMEKNKRAFFDQKVKEIRRYYKEIGVKTSNKKVRFYAESAMRAEIFKDEPLSPYRKSVITARMQQILVGSVTNPFVAPEQQGEPPLITTPMPAGEIDLEDTNQFAQAVQTYASGLYQKSGAGSGVPSTRDALAALIWRCDTMRMHAQAGDNETPDWVGLRGDIDNLLGTDGAVLTAHQRETLIVLRARVNERALLSVCNAFKAELREQLKGLDEIGGRRNLHFGFSLGVSGGFGEVADLLGGELRVSIDMQFVNNDYKIYEIKEVTGGISLHAGDKKIAQVAAGGSVGKATWIDFRTVEDVVEHHAGDLFAVLLPMSLGNAKGASSVRLRRQLTEARAGDREVLRDRLTQQGVLTQGNTLAPASDARTKGPGLCHVRTYTGKIGANVAEGIVSVNATGQFLDALVELPTALSQHLKNQPEEIQKAKASYFVTAGERMTHGTVRDRANEYLNRFQKINAMIQDTVNPQQREALLQIRKGVQQEIQTFCQSVAEHELATLEMYTHAVNLYDSVAKNTRDTAQQRGLRDLKHSLERAKGANGRAEYLRSAVHLTELLGQLTPILNARSGADALAAVDALKAKVAEPGIFVRRDAKTKKHLQHLSYLHPTISVAKYDATVAVPESPLKFSVSSTTSETKDLTPDRDGVTKDIQFTLPAGKVVEPFVHLLDTNILKKQGVEFRDFAADLGVGIVEEGVFTGIEKVGETLSELAGVGFGLGIQSDVRFDLRLKKINGKWKMLYLRAMDVAGANVAVPVSVPVATGVNVTAKVEASAAKTDQIRMRLGSDTLMLIKSRYTTWKEANALKTRWAAFTEKHEAEFKRLLKGMVAEKSNVRREAQEMLRKAKDMGILDERHIDKDIFEAQLANAVQQYAAEDTHANYTAAMGKLVELLDINSSIFEHEMGERVRAAKLADNA